MKIGKIILLFLVIIQVLPTIIQSALVERRYLLLIVKARTLQSVYTLPIFLTRRGERTYKGRSDGLITSEQLIFECDSVV